MLTQNVRRSAKWLGGSSTQRVCAILLGIGCLAANTAAFEPLAQSSSLEWWTFGSGNPAASVFRSERYEVSDLLPIAKQIENASQTSTLSDTGATIDMFVRATVNAPGGPDFSASGGRSEYQLEFEAEPGAAYDLSGVVDVNYDFIFFNDVASVQMVGPGLDLFESFSPDEDRQYSYRGTLPGGVYQLQLVAWGEGSLDAQSVERMTGILQVDDGKPHVPAAELPLFRLIDVDRDSESLAGRFDRIYTTTNESMPNGQLETTVDVRRQSSWVSQRAIRAEGVDVPLSATLEPIPTTPESSITDFRLQGRFDGEGLLKIERQAECEACWETIDELSGIAGGERLFGKRYPLDDVPYRLTATGNYEFVFVPEIAGDLTLDSYVDAADINELTAAIVAGESRADYDLDGDGLLSQADRIIWVEQLAGSLFGDADLNGQFDSTDLIAIFQAGEYEDEVVGNSVWETGDWNGDAEFTSGDIIFALQRGSYTAESAARAVPEPTAGGVASLAIVGMLLVSRRRLA